MELVHSSVEEEFATSKCTMARPRFGTGAVKLEAVVWKGDPNLPPTQQRVDAVLSERVLHK